MGREKVELSGHFELENTIPCPTLKICKNFFTINMSLIMTIKFLLNGLTLMQLNYFCGFTLNRASHRDLAYNNICTVFDLVYLGVSLRREV